jgi:hypothetical protein
MNATGSDARTTASHSHVSLTRTPGVGGGHNTSSSSTKSIPPDLRTGRGWALETSH